jgi:hypothetical protein
MLPTYWLAGAPQIDRQNNARTSQSWMAAAFGDSPADTYGIVVQKVIEPELTHTGEFTATMVLMLEVLVDRLAEEGASLTPELTSQLPRRGGPMPAAFETVTLGVLDIDGDLVLSRILKYGQLQAFITIHEGHWLCVLAPSALRPKLVSVDGQVSGGWQRPADAGP